MIPPSLPPSPGPDADLLQHCFAANPQPMWIFDAETLRFLAVNEAALALYGYSRAQFLELTVRDIRPEEDVPAFLSRIREAPPESGRTGPWRHRRRDGQLLLVEIAARRMSCAGRPAWLVRDDRLGMGPVDRHPAIRR
ncbi:MAG: PAS domain-containing protein [Verrucomicrobia bacterium]|nr:PAS domain-containing protein [Verrucomicrobiota bacterium]